jgi:hypothetical protein
MITNVSRVMAKNPVGNANHQDAIISPAIVIAAVSASPRRQLRCWVQIVTK